METATDSAIEVAVAVLSGPGVNQVGNTLIIGHNYRNGTFFSNNKKFKKEIYSLLRHNAIAFPVVMDSLSQINKLNNFPDDRRFQTIFCR